MVIDCASITDDAEISGFSVVKGNSVVCETAYVSDNTTIDGNSQIMGSSHIHGNATISGFSLIRGEADISSNNNHLVIGPLGHSGGYLTAHTDSEIGLRVNCDEFSGSTEDFIQWSKNQIDPRSEGSIEWISSMVSFIEARPSFMKYKSDIALVRDLLRPRQTD